MELGASSQLLKQEASALIRKGTCGLSFDVVLKFSLDVQVWSAALVGISLCFLDLAFVFLAQSA